MSECRLPRNFNPRSPHGERLAASCARIAVMPISIHAPRTGSDEKKVTFLPLTEISIHAPRTGSDLGIFAKGADGEISIHAPRTGSDAAERWPLLSGLQYFNPRSPHGERRQNGEEVMRWWLFQSTLPARGATLVTYKLIPWIKSNFNPRSPHGERQHAVGGRLMANRISIHAPRTGSDTANTGQTVRTSAFQSTLPARGATEEKTLLDWNGIFQSTLPARGATRAASRRLSGQQFQSTLPARGATAAASSACHSDKISIHAPRTGSDPTDGDAQAPPRKISIHAPRTGSDTNEAAERRNAAFQSTLPARGATTAQHPDSPRGGHFNPRSPHGERRRCRRLSATKTAFQSTLPARGATG